MKYKLLMEGKSNHQITCACGKCKPSIYIDESMKEEFKQMMGWSEDTFIKSTIVVRDPKQSSRRKKNV